MLDLKRKKNKQRRWVNAITILMFSCLHGHFRRDSALTPIVVRHASQGFEINLWEPNLTPPVTTGDMAVEYQNYLQVYFEEVGDGSHRLIMTLYLTPHTTEEDIERAYAMGVRVAKLYYKVTTNSEHGVTHWRQAGVAIAAMEKICQRCPEDPMFLQVHAEVTEEPEHHKREAACVVHMEDLVATHPYLWIAIEHVTTRVMLEFVARHRRVGASVTLHHLLLTWGEDCVEHGKLKPHCYCAPVVKDPDDRQALLDAAMGKVRRLMGKVWLGLDFAPHDLQFKEAEEWAWPPKDGRTPRMGVYSLDVTVPLLVALFERYGGRWWLKRLECFASTAGPDWYRIARPAQYMRVVRKSYRVPSYYAAPDGRPVLRSFMADQEIDWQVKEVRIAA